MYDIDAILEDSAKNKQIILESYEYIYGDPLLEDYSLPDEMGEEEPEEGGEENIDAPEAEEGSEDTSNYSLDDTEDDSEGDEPAGDEDSEDDLDAGGDDDSDIIDEDTDGMGESETEEDAVPKLKVLNLSEKDIKLNNLALFRKFKELYQNIDYSLNIITNKVVRGQRQKQVSDIVTANLNSMETDMMTYMKHKFDSSYETNMTAYLTYLKRYNIAVELIRLLSDEKTS